MDCERGAYSSGSDADASLELRPSVMIAEERQVRGQARRVLEQIANGDRLAIGAAPRGRQSADPIVERQHAASTARIDSVVVAMTLVSDARSKMVSSVVAGGVGFEGEPAERPPATARVRDVRLRSTAAGTRERRSRIAAAGRAWKISSGRERRVTASVVCSRVYLDKAPRLTTSR